MDITAHPEYYHDDPKNFQSEWEFYVVGFENGQ